MDSIKNRRTIRKYKSQDIPENLLNGLLEESFRASTMGNMQLYSVVVTRSDEMKSKLAPMHFNPFIYKCPFRRVTGHSKLLYPCRRSRIRNMLFRYNHL